MVKSSTQWDTRDRVLAVGMVGAWAVAVKYEVGIVVGLVCAIAAPFVFGRQKWKGEVSAYSVCNADGRRIAGTFTAEQFDAQLRGGPRPTDDGAPARMGAVADDAAEAAPAPPDDPALRRRRAAEAADRRLKGAS